MYTLLYAFYIGAVCTLYSMHSMHVHMHMLPRAWRGAPLQYPSTVVEYLRTAAPLYLSSTSAAPLHLCGASATLRHLCGTSAPLHLCLQVAAHRRAQQLATQLQQSFKNAPVIPLDWRPADMESEVAVVAYPQPQP